MLRHHLRRRSTIGRRRQWLPRDDFGRLLQHVLTMVSALLHDERNKWLPIGR
jgi:hypothetical protein